MNRVGVIALWVLLSAAPGCIHDEGTTLDRDAFYRPPPGTDTQRHVLQDRPGPLQYDTVRVDLLEPQQGKPAPPAPDPQVTAISPAVQQMELPTSSGEDARLSNGNAPATGPTTAPQKRPAPGPSRGTAMTIGGVVCEVNGSAIFADKVLQSLSKLLAAEAKRRDERAFRALATVEINDEVQKFIETELAFAAAEKNLDAKEKELAHDFTMQWRQRQITEAGGSLERAKARAAADGYEFEERVEDEFRNTMVRLYYTKRLMPRAQVRAEEMRRYYNDNVRKLFTEYGQAHFRVIKVDLKRSGGEVQAQEKIENLRERAARGEDFAELAKGSNDDPNLMRNGGDVGWVQRGAFVLEPVEEAVWSIQPGEITPIVKITDALYIAKLEEVKRGRIRAFEEDAVQKQIMEALRGQRLAELRNRERDGLMRDAIVHPNPPDVGPVIEMAMQRYSQWASAEK